MFILFSKAVDVAALDREQEKVFFFNLHKVPQGT